MAVLSWQSCRGSVHCTVRNQAHPHTAIPKMPKSTKPKKTKPPKPPKMVKSCQTKPASILKKPKSTKPKPTKPTKPKPPKRGRIRWRFPIASTHLEWHFPTTVVEPMEKVNLAETFTELPELIDPKWPAAIALADELYGDL